MSFTLPQVVKIGSIAVCDQTIVGIFQQSCCIIFQNIFCGHSHHLINPMTPVAVIYLGGILKTNYIST